MAANCLVVWFVPHRYRSGCTAALVGGTGCCSRWRQQLDCAAAQSGNGEFSSACRSVGDVRLPADTRAAAHPGNFRARSHSTISAPNAAARQRWRSPALQFDDDRGFGTTCRITRRCYSAGPSAQRRPKPFRPGRGLDFVPGPVIARSPWARCRGAVQPNQRPQRRSK
jgi:hypothetical protein